MSTYQWKPFQFFDKDVVRDEKGQPLPFIEKLEITCCTCGRGHLAFGDHEGAVHIVDRTYRVETFQAYEGVVTHLKQLKSSNTLISVGTDSGGSLKIWSLEKKDKDGHPQHLKTIKLFAKFTPPPAIPLRLNLNPKLVMRFFGNAAAAAGGGGGGGDGPPGAAGDGGADGHVGEIESTALKSSIVCVDMAEDLNYAAVGLSNGDTMLIKGDLVRDRNPKIRILNSRSDSRSAVSFVGFKKAGAGFSLFVAHGDCAVLWRLTAKGETEQELAREIGAPPDCVCLSEEGELVIARQDAIYFFNDELDGRGPCFAIDGDKRKVYWFRLYLIVVTQDPQDDSKFHLTIFDLKNKLKSFTGPTGVFLNMSFILSDWGSIFILANEGKNNARVNQRLYQLEEKDAETKLEMLFKKSLYAVAITLANSQQFDWSYIIEIFKKYGDHLYAKGDYDAAVAQYVRTIGKLEPSYVIRKFLDAQRIHNLTKYLEELHQHRKANADHTTLLLNCYTKLKDLDKLDKFIRETGSTFAYDVEVAIKVCRQASYHEHALELAHKHKEHNWYLKIQIEDNQNYAEALAYIKNLDLLDASEYLQAYGKMLVSKQPEETTKVLMDICTSWVPARPAGSPAPTQTRVRPELFIKAFVDAPYYLMVFLECVVKNKLTISDEPGQSNTIVWNTLLELYLTKRLRKSVADKSEDWTRELDGDMAKRREKALGILRNPEAKYDPEHALVLVQTHGFRDGILYLYEKLKLFQDILNYYMQIRDYPNVILSCKKFGSKDPNMWVQVLNYFVQFRDQDFTEEIQDILHHIDKENLLPPLVVLQILSKNSKTKLDTIRQYIRARLEAEMKAIEEDERKITEYKEDTKRMRAELKDMQTNAQIFQLVKCSSCGSPLDLPNTHFLCKHSFHHRCLGENEECHICAPQLKMASDIKRNLDEAVDNHDQYFAQLKEAPDGFSTVAEYFGRGIFNGKYDPAPGLADDFGSADDDDSD